VHECQCPTVLPRKQWQRNNPDKMRHYQRTSYVKNRDKLIAWHREYHRNHKEQEADYRRKYIEANREKMRERRRLRQLRNPEEKRIHVRLRRKRIAIAQGHHTPADVKRQYEAQRGKCYYCGCELNGTYQTDHVIPISRGGSDSMENIVVACASCNLSKGNKLPHEWAGSNRLL
jgi:5-methylcytosine-specific restriction endonuclease McrA